MQKFMVELTPLEASVVDRALSIVAGAYHHNNDLLVTRRSAQASLSGWTGEPMRALQRVRRKLARLR